MGQYRRPGFGGDWPVAIDELNREALALARQNAGDAARLLAEAGIGATWTSAAATRPIS